MKHPGKSLIVCAHSVRARSPHILFTPLLLIALGCDVETEPLTAEGLKEFCAGKLAHYKVPRYVKIVDEFPMTVTGKIRKVEMRTVSVEELGLQGAAAVKNA